MAQNKDDSFYDGKVDGEYDENYTPSGDDDLAYSADTSDEWVDDVDDQFIDGEEPSAEQPVRQKKKSNFILYTVLALVVLGAGVFFLASGDKTPPEEIVVVDHSIPPANLPETSSAPQDGQVASSPDVSSNPSPAPVLVDAVPVDVAPDGQGMMTNPEVLNQGDTNQSAPQVSEVAPDTDVVSAEASNTNSLVETISPDVKPVSDFPTAQSIKKPDEDVSSKDDVVENVVSEPSPVVQPTVPKEAELDLALEKISSLEKLVAEKDSALEAQKSKLEMQADTNASTSELQTKIDELEKKLAAFEKQSPVETVEDKKPEPVSIKKASDVALTKAVEKPVKTVSSQWILKGANSNKAILSDKRTGDLKTISIGQTVPGLGRILSISESGSGWSVKGTLATVTE